MSEKPERLRVSLHHCWAASTLGVLVLVLILAFAACTTAQPTDLTPQPTLLSTPLLTPSSTPWPTMVDRGLLYGDPCDPPCWEGITPGVSSRCEVVQILERLEAEGRVRYFTVQDSRYYNVKLLLDGQLEVFFGEDEQTVSDLMIRGLAFDHRVRQAIERFGEPEGCFVGFGFLKTDEEYSCSCADWERDYDSRRSHTDPGYLFYPSQGVTLQIAIPWRFTGCVCPEMRISMILYYQPTSMADALQEGGTIPFDGLDLGDEDIVPWHGYGSGY